MSKAKLEHHHEFHGHGSASDAPKIGSDRSFCLVFTSVFLLLTGYNFWHGGRVWPLYLIIALTFLGFAVWNAAALHPLNRLWMKLGMLLGMIINPIVLAFLFFVVITPFGLVRQWSGADPLRLRRNPQIDSYWIIRDPPGPAGDSMREQF